MPCEHYKDALTETVAMGAETTSALRTHLEACPSCRSAFAEERRLFAAIDTGLRSVANGEPSLSFFPRVRGRLDEMQASKHHCTSALIFVAASVALVFAMFLALRSHQPAPGGQTRQIPATSPREAQRANSFVAPASGNPARTRRKNVSLHVEHSNQPEVIVPPDEREAFARFVATLRERGDVAVALVIPSAEETSALASAEQIQIRRLEVKPLEGTESETSDSAQNIR
jgi:hypothetical protein